MSALDHRDRKVRPFGVACCRLLAPWFRSARILKALAAAERYADETLGDSGFGNWEREVTRL